MAIGVKNGWNDMPKPPQKYDWKLQLKKAQGKNIFNDKVAQIQHILKEEDMTGIIKKGYMKVLMNIPPSTLGYTKNECIVSWKSAAMTHVDLINIAKEDNKKYKKGAIEPPSRSSIAVGYKLVREEDNNKKRKFQTYIIPTDDCERNKAKYYELDKIENPTNKRFRPNTLWYPYYPWVAYARCVLTHQKGPSLPIGVADKILSYFEWRENSHQEQNLKHESPNNTSFWAPEPYCHPPIQQSRNDFMCINEPKTGWKSLW